MKSTLTPFLAALLLAPLASDYRDGQLRLTIPKVEIHDVVAVQTK